MEHIHKWIKVGASPVAERPVKTPVSKINKTRQALPCHLLGSRSWLPLPRKLTVMAQGAVTLHAQGDLDWVSSCWVWFDLFPMVVGICGITSSWEISCSVSPIKYLSTYVKLLQSLSKLLNISNFYTSFSYDGNGHRMTKFKKEWQKIINTLHIIRTSWQMNHNETC